MSLLPLCSSASPFLLFPTGFSFPSPPGHPSVCYPCSPFAFISFFGDVSEQSLRAALEAREQSKACELCSLSSEASLQGQAGHGDSRVLGGGGVGNLIWI